MARTSVTIILLCFTIGCQSTGMNKGAYQHRLKEVELGMSKDEFYELFPGGVPRGAKAYPDGQVEVIEVNYGEYSFFPSGSGTARNGLTGMEARPNWFYFYKDKLIQYGAPGDWPAEPDKVYQIQVR